MEYILNYLIEILFTLLTAIIVFMYNKVKKLINTIDSNKISLLTITKDLFIQKYYYYKRQNSICIYEKESIKILYTEYKKLGGNGIVDTLIKEIEKIPLIDDNFKGDW